jgi:glutathione synthase/RimK-type ligase-like ATP-grasp enzyme
MRTGTLKAAMDGTARRQEFPAHPDHGAQIEGVQIPYFAESLALAAHSVLAFPGIRFAGVDVAISQNGPSVIELNTSPDRIGAAFVEVPVRDLL